MIDEKVLEKVRLNVSTINSLCHDYQMKRSEHEAIVKRIEDIQRELDRIREEEQLRVELAKIAYLPEKIKETKVDVLEREKSQEEQNLLKVAGEMASLRRQILSEGKNLRFPVKAGFRREDGAFVFEWFEDVRFSEDTLSVLCELLELPTPPTVEGATFSLDKVTVSAKDGKEAIQVLIKAIQTVRLKTEAMLNVFDKIDDFVNRIRNSERYSPVLEAIYDAKQPLSINELAEKVNQDENIVYNTCYNLMRETWNPSPIRKLGNGRYELSAIGSIIMKRYRDKYPKFKREIEPTNARMSSMDRL